MIHILMQLIIATLPKTWLCSQRWRGGWWSGEQWMVICAHSLVGRMERDWWWQSKVETSCSTLLIILSPYQDPRWRQRFCRWSWWWWCGRGRRQAAAPPRNCALLIFLSPPPLPSFTYNQPTEQQVLLLCQKKSSMIPDLWKCLVAYFECKLQSSSLPSTTEHLRPQY